jgi:rubrerythrin
MLAEYECLKCGFLYESFPGPTQCPRCNHLYIKWHNYIKDFLKYNPNHVTDS